MGLYTPVTAIFNSAEDAKAYADRLEEIKFSLKGKTVTIDAPEGIIDCLADDSQEFYDSLKRNKE